MYLKTQDLIQFLYKWKCKFTKFYSCLIDLSEQMALNHFWESDEVTGIKNWLNDLNGINYIEPNKLIMNMNYMN